PGTRYRALLLAGHPAPAPDVLRHRGPWEIASVTSGRRKPPVRWCTDTARRQGRRRRSRRPRRTAPVPTTRDAPAMPASTRASRTDPVVAKDGWAEEEPA